MVVSFFYFHPYLEKIPILTNIFETTNQIQGFALLMWIPMNFTKLCPKNLPLRPISLAWLDISGVNDSFTALLGQVWWTHSCEIYVLQRWTDEVSRRKNGRIGWNWLLVCVVFGLVSGRVCCWKTHGNLGRSWYLWGSLSWYSTGFLHRSDTFVCLCFVCFGEFSWSKKKVPVILRNIIW